MFYSVTFLFVVIELNGKVFFMQALVYFVVPMIISAILILPVKALAFRFGIFAVENQRTVHHGKIPRIGGAAIFLGFLIGFLLFCQETTTFRGLLLGGALIFIGGLIDDIFDLKPIIKLIIQFAAATILIFVGNVHLDVIHLPFNLVIHFQVLNYLVTYLWIVGITNAINLIDGLDGLAGGFSIIVLITISILSRVVSIPDAFIVSLVLAGSTMGFLFYNFNPASIFMGDCGSQFLGFMIAAISLFGFKSTTFITLAIPIILLFVPIFDTFSAIIRRKLAGEKITTADKGHFHHILMNNMGLGVKGAVITIYIVTILFGFVAYMYVKDKYIALLMLIFLMFIFDLFIEYTGMISPKYRPILNLVDRLMKKEKHEDN